MRPPASLTESTSCPGLQDLHGFLGVVAQFTLSAWVGTDAPSCAPCFPFRMASPKTFRSLRIPPFQTFQRDVQGVGAGDRCPPPRPDVQQQWGDPESRAKHNSIAKSGTPGSATPERRHLRGRRSRRSFRSPRVGHGGPLPQAAQWACASATGYSGNRLGGRQRATGDRCEGAQARSCLQHFQRLQAAQDPGNRARNPAIRAAGHRLRRGWPGNHTGDNKAPAVVVDRELALETQRAGGHRGRPASPGVALPG